MTIDSRPLQRCWQKKRRVFSLPPFLTCSSSYFLFLKSSISFSSPRSEIPSTMRRLRAIVPPFGVEEDVRWVEEDVPEEDDEEGSDRFDAHAAATANGDASTLSTSTLDSSHLEPEVLAPGARRCLPPAPSPGSKPSILAILK